MLNWQVTRLLNSTFSAGVEYRLSLSQFVAVLAMKGQ